MGPKTLPCTSLVTSIELDIISFKRTCCFLRYRKLESHWKKLPVMPYDLTLLSSFGLVVVIQNQRHFGSQSRLCLFAVTFAASKLIPVNL